MVAKYLFSNVASSLLAAPITAVDVVISVTPGQGGLFPQPGADEAVMLAIENPAGDLEYVLCTGRTGDDLTVTRAQEGTAALPFGIDARVEVRLTAGTLDRFAQETDDGDLIVPSGIIVVNFIRGDVGLVANEIRIPANGDEPSVAGATILTSANYTDYTVPKLGGTFTGATNVLHNGATEKVTIGRNDGDYLAIAEYSDGGLELRPYVDSVMGERLSYNPTLGKWVIGNKDATDQLIGTTTGAANYVSLTGNQTVNGAKTFTTIITLPNVDPTSNNQAARKKYVDDKIASEVTAKLDPLQEINGVGSFVFAIRSGTCVYGNNYSGSTLRPAGVYANVSFDNNSSVLSSSGASLPGTWKCLGHQGNGVNLSNPRGGTLFVRVA